MKIIAVGKVKERFIVDGIQEFLKRQPLAKLEVIEVKDEKITKEEEKVKQKEGKSILKQVKPNDYLVALDETGEELSSIEFAVFLKQWPNAVFAIGGPLGLSEEVKDKALLKLSLSKMTYPHQFARLMLIEQIYRGFMILKNKPYHK